MTIVDTSVWIEFFEGGSHWTKERLKMLLNDREPIAYLELIFLELVYGIRDRDMRLTLESRFQHFRLLPMRRSITLLAAEIHQGCLSKGFKIRSMVDCVIAAAAIETGAGILQKDRDFDHVARIYPLILVGQV